MAQVDPRCNEIVAGLPGVNRAVRDEARARGKRARATLNVHRFLGNETNHRILVRKANRYDWFVILEGPAPIPVEYGHIAEDGTRVEGLRILRGAFDM